MIKSGLATVASSMQPVLARSGVLETVLFKDTFTDVNGTLLQNHTPDIDLSGNGWTGGGWDIQNNRAEGSNQYVVADATDADRTMTISVIGYIPPGNLRFLVKYQDVSNYVDANYTSGAWSITERTSGGGIVVRASTGYGITGGEDQSVTVTTSGTTTTATISSPTPGEVSISYGSTVLSSETNFALRTSAPNQPFDDLLVVS